MVIIIFFELSLTRQGCRDSAGAMAAHVPSAGMKPYQTDFAFLPV
jgi:hypothetical protein